MAADRRDRRQPPTDLRLGLLRHEEAAVGAGQARHRLFLEPAQSRLVAAAHIALEGACARSACRAGRRPPPPSAGRISFSASRSIVPLLGVERSGDAVDLLLGHDVGTACAARSRRGGRRSPRGTLEGLHELVMKAVQSRGACVLVSKSGWDVSLIIVSCLRRIVGQSVSLRTGRSGPAPQSAGGPRDRRQADQPGALLHREGDERDLPEIDRHQAPAVAAPAPRRASLVRKPMDSPSSAPAATARPPRARRRLQGEVRPRHRDRCGPRGSASSAPRAAPDRAASSMRMPAVPRLRSEAAKAPGSIASPA